MKSKAYIKPAIRVVKLQHQNHILYTSMNRAEGNASLRYSGGSSGPARARSFNDWCDEDDWDE